MRATVIVYLSAVAFSITTVGWPAVLHAFYIAEGHRQAAAAKAIATNATSDAVRLNERLTSPFIPSEEVETVRKSLNRLADYQSDLARLQHIRALSATGDARQVTETVQSFEGFVEAALGRDSMPDNSEYVEEFKRANLPLTQADVDRVSEIASFLREKDSTSQRLRSEITQLEGGFTALSSVHDTLQSRAAIAHEAGKPGYQQVSDIRDVSSLFKQIYDDNGDYDVREGASIGFSWSYSCADYYSQLATQKEQADNPYADHAAIAEQLRSYLDRLKQYGKSFRSRLQMIRSRIHKLRNSLPPDVRDAKIVPTSL